MSDREDQGRGKGRGKRRREAGRRRGEEGVCLARGLGLINIIPSQIEFTLNIIIIIEYFREFSLSPPSPALVLRVNKWHPLPCGGEKRRLGVNMTIIPAQPRSGPESSLAESSTLIIPEVVEHGKNLLLTFRHDTKYCRSPLCHNDTLKGPSMSL